MRLRPESDPPLHQAAPPANVDLKSMVRLRRESDPPLHQAAPPANMDLESMVPMAELHHRPAVVHGPVTVDVRGEPAGWKPARAWIPAA